MCYAKSAYYYPSFVKGKNRPKVSAAEDNYAIYVTFPTCFSAIYVTFPTFCTNYMGTICPQEPHRHMYPILLNNHD